VEVDPRGDETDVHVWYVSTMTSAGFWKKKGGSRSAEESGSIE
jgi:hypothetical protein